MAGVLKPTLMITTIDQKYVAILTVLINIRPDEDISNTEISDLAGYSLPTVERHMRVLKEKGIITPIQRGNSRTRKSRYQVHPIVYALIKRKSA